jgi:hypothetical protein
MERLKNHRNAAQSRVALLVKEAPSGTRAAQGSLGRFLQVEGSVRCSQLIPPP